MLQSKKAPPLQRMSNVVSFEIKKMKNDLFLNYYLEDKLTLKHQKYYELVSKSHPTDQ